VTPLSWLGDARHGLQRTIGKRSNEWENVEEGLKIMEGKFGNEVWTSNEFTGKSLAGNNIDVFVKRYTQDESCVFVVYHSREPI
jgi:hypothetical protein